MSLFKILICVTAQSSTCYLVLFIKLCRKTRFFDFICELNLHSKQVYYSIFVVPLQLVWTTKRRTYSKCLEYVDLHINIGESELSERKTKLTFLSAVSGSHSLLFSRSSNNFFTVRLQSWKNARCYNRSISLRNLQCNTSCKRRILYSTGAFSSPLLVFCLTFSSFNRRT